ncbi:nuclear pore complex protein NUP1 isoform X2 [Salvia hispanica]|uniref:nuclear pore complex protein NUP1 isoform X2 n=1 Tax=Salvia hispanica TaxID=49212 RepID=UPI0020097454|nr:nuclear pore complex protein NUP1 isoform X2 [Salvia hispanica]
MSTAEEGGATVNANTSSYGGGGAGGKFRKKPFRRQATPYDRPPTALRGNSTNSNDSSSWLTKLVVEPASKLISYGADRFFGSILRRRLPPPPLPLRQPPESEAQDGLAESNTQDSDMDQGIALNRGDREPGSGQCIQPINSSSSNGITELEHLLKQKTFTRSEIAHLAELLQSRAAEECPGDVSRINVVSALDSSRQKEFASGALEENRIDGVGSSAVMFTPVNNSRVVESDIASPAELAKAYMGSRPSQVSPSLLGMRNQLGKERTVFHADTLNPSWTPIVSLAKRSSVSMSAVENGFITPRSQGRSAIYTMPRTPYSRVHRTSTLKGSGINSSGFAGPSTSSSSLSPLENDGNFDSRLGTLKRRSSALDDEIGSVVSVRRIRQKSNSLTSSIRHTAHGVGVGSHVIQKPQMNGEERNKVLKNSGENENERVSSTSYFHVPSKSKEVAAKILQQLEMISPKEKLPVSKLEAMPENSPSKLISNRLSGRALRSLEDVGSSKLPLNVQDDLKSGDPNGILPDVHESSPLKQGKAEGNGPNVSFISSGRWNSVINNDAAVSLKTSTSGLEPGDSVVKNGASQPQKKRAFRMSAEEDPLELPDVDCNGLASRSENKGPFENLHAKPAGESQTTFQSKDKSSMGFLTSRSTSELTSGVVTFGKGTSVIDIPASEGERAASQSQIVSSSLPAFDKPKEANSSHLFSFSSKATDNSPSLPSESTKSAKSPERSSSFANNSTLVGSQVKTGNSETGFHTKPVKEVDTNGKCGDGSSVALNGPSVSRSSPVSFPAASFSDMRQTSTGSAPLLTSSTSTTNILPTGSSTSTAVPSSGSIFGGAVKSSSSGGPVFKFGSSVDPPTIVSAAPTASISERADQRAEIDTNLSSGSSSSIFKFGSSFSNSTGNSLQSSLFASATKSPVFGAGTISQCTSTMSFPSASVPALNMNVGSSLGSVPTPSISFGFSSSSSTSTSDTTSLVPAGGPTSSLFKFGATPAAVTEGSAVSSSAATPSAFSFGLSSSSPTTTVCSSSGPTTSVFGFGGTSVSSATINTNSSFSSGTSGVLGFGEKSSFSSSTANSTSGVASNVFGSGWPSQKSPLFSSPFSSASPSSGFSFSASANAAPAGAASSGPIFSFTTASASPSQPVFGGGFAASPGNNDQMNAEDSMAEDPVPSSAPTPVFGQASVSPVPPTFAFGSAAPSQNNLFMFSSQQNQVPLQSPSFQASGSFSLGSTGGDKSGRRIVKVNRSKNRKK